MKESPLEFIERLYRSLPDKPFKAHAVISEIAKYMASDKKKIASKTEFLVGCFILMERLKWIEQIPPSEIEGKTSFFRKLPKPEKINEEEVKLWAIGREESISKT